MTDILIIQGHPDGSKPHYCHALGEAYRDGAEKAGHSVKVVDIGKIEIAPLRSSDQWRAKEGPEFANDAREAITWAAHIVLIYPLWMGTLPAHLKAFLEHVFSEDFAFDMSGPGWNAKLKGRSARVVVTMGMPAAAYRYFFFAHSLRSLRRNMLGFAGFSPIRDSVIGQVEAKNPKNREKWLDRMRQFGAEAT